MAGLIMKKDRIERLLDNADSSFSFSYWHPVSDIVRESHTDTALDVYDDGPSSSNCCKDVPVRFHSNPNRFYFEKYHDSTSTIYSMYNCLARHLNWYPSWSLFKEPIDCVIILMSDNLCAAAVYQSGKMVASREIGSKASTTGRTTANIKQMIKGVESLIKEWDQFLRETPRVIVRCAAIHKAQLFEGQYRKDSVFDKLRHVPFETKLPSLEEVERVYDHLGIMYRHGTVDECLQDILKRKSKRATGEAVLKPADVISSHGQRRAEKQMWPSLDAGTINKIMAAVNENDYDSLMNLVEEHKQPLEMISYLSMTHEKLGNASFLHYAVHHRLDNSIECLLDLGCDPAIEDDDGKTPYQCAKDDEIREVFVKFRASHPETYQWSKCAVPEELASPVEHRTDDGQPSRDRTKNEKIKRRREYKDVARKAVRHDYD